MESVADIVLDVYSQFSVEDKLAFKGLLKEVDDANQPLTTQIENVLTFDSCLTGLQNLRRRAEHHLQFDEWINQKKKRKTCLCGKLEYSLKMSAILHEDCQSMLRLR